MTPTPDQAGFFLHHSSAVHKTNQRHRKLKQFVVNKTHLCSTHRSKILRFAWIFHYFPIKETCKVYHSDSHSPCKKRSSMVYRNTFMQLYLNRGGVQVSSASGHRLDEEHTALMASSGIRMSLTSWGEGKTVYPAIFIYHYFTGF